LNSKALSADCSVATGISHQFPPLGGGLFSKVISPLPLEIVAQIVFHQPGFRGERRRIGGNKPAMRGLLVVRKGNVGDFLNRIGNLASGKTKVNTDANYERITASLCKRTPKPRLEPPPPIAT